MNVFLVTKRKPLSALPWFWRWAIRFAYFKTGWASDYSVEYQGVYAEEGEAYWASSADGMSYTELPMNGSLPEETVQYGAHDFPTSEASSLYRRNELPTVAIPRDLMEAALQVSKDMLDCAQNKCTHET